MRLGRLLAVGGAIGVVLTVGAPEAADKHWRVGFLSSASPTSVATRVQAFRDGLRELDYVEGRNLTIEYRWTEGKDARLAELAADLVSRRVDVIVTQGTVPTIAASKATSTIPIVFATAGDAVRAGLAKSLARPGGNVTGLTIIAPETTGKRLELIREMAPQVQQLAVFVNPSNPVSIPELKETYAAAAALGLRIHAVEAPKADAFDLAFAGIAEGRSGAVIVLSDILFLGQRSRILALAAKNGLPAIAWTREFAESGALMSYGPDQLDMHRRAAIYVDKVLRGAKPADLPIEGPVKFELIINLNTARTLGLVISPALLLRADGVVE